MRSEAIRGLALHPPPDVLEHGAEHILLFTMLPSGGLQCLSFHFLHVYSQVVLMDALSLVVQALSLIILVVHGKQKLFYLMLTTWAFDLI